MKKKKVNSIQKFLDSCSTHCHPWGVSKKMAVDIFGYKPDDEQSRNPAVVFQWSKQGKGFGEFLFKVNEKNGITYCSNEYCSKEFIKEMLCKMVDDCILKDKC